MDAVDLGLRSFEKTRTLQILAWDKWVLVDDVIAGSVQKGIDWFPIIKKGKRLSLAGLRSLKLTSNILQGL